MDGLYQNPPHCLHREILLSLRFILGGTRKSRKLAKKLALPSLPAEARDAAFDELLEGNLDRMLIASSADPRSKKLIEQDFLTPWIDFPLLGERMLQIQRYNEQQRPTSTKSMIRDKRNPAQWYTLWAVLLLGGIGVILSLLQLAVSIAQLVVSLPARD